MKYINSLLSYEGRFRRLEFIIALKAIGLFSIFFIFFVIFIPFIGIIISAVSSYIAAYALICSVVKRISDIYGDFKINKIPYVIIFPLIFIPFMNFFVLLYLSIYPGRKKFPKD